MEIAFRPHEPARNRPARRGIALWLPTSLAAAAALWAGSAFLRVDDADAAFERTLPLVFDKPLAEDTAFLLGLGHSGATDVAELRVLASGRGTAATGKVTFAFDAGGEAIAERAAARGDAPLAPALVLAFRRGEEPWRAFPQLAPSADQVAAWPDYARYVVRVPEPFAAGG